MKNFFETYLAGTIIIVGIICAVLSVLFFTSASYTCWNFSSTGQIGDTIGGLTAPVIGIINAVLLWYTLRKQSIQIRDQRVDAAIDRKIDTIRDEIKTFHVKIIKVTEEDNLNLSGKYKGQLAVIKVTSIFSNKLFKDYDIDPHDWRAFSHLSLSILMMVQNVLTQNYTSRREVSEKTSTFRLAFTLILPLMKMYEDIARARNVTPASEGIEKFDLSIYEDDLNQSFFMKYNPEPNDEANKIVAQN